MKEENKQRWKITRTQEEDSCKQQEVLCETDWRSTPITTERYKRRWRTQMTNKDDKERGQQTTYTTNKEDDKQERWLASQETNSKNDKDNKKNNIYNWKKNFSFFRLSLATSIRFWVMSVFLYPIINSCMSLIFLSAQILHSILWMKSSNTGDERTC